MVTVIKKPATVADLYKVADGGKAELVKGELRLIAPTGLRPGFASSKIWLSLYRYVQDGHSGRGRGRQRWVHCRPTTAAVVQPDAAYFTGVDSGMKFAQGAPVFAVEIRSENDYGPAAEREMAAKRADHFAAGTSSSGMSISSATKPSGSFAQATLRTRPCTAVA